MDGKNVKALHLNGFDYETDAKQSKWAQWRYMNMPPDIFYGWKNVKELHLNGFDYETDTKHCQNVLSHGAGWL